MTTTTPDRIVIDPVTRIEGHAKITIHLDEAGEVRDAQFHVTQFRGFERIVQGRPLHEMPSIMARICGICPVSHLVASAKACDEIIAVEPPPAGADLRRVMNLAQIAQSNALSFFHLASPDLLFGFDAEAAGRNLFGVAAAAPQLARDGIAIRRFGQQVIEWLGGKRIHPSWIVPGGVDAPLAVETRDRILAAIPDAIAASERAIAWYDGKLARFEDEAASFGDFPSAYMALVDRDGAVDHYDGLLRVVAADGTMLADRVDPRGYADLIGEAVEPWSFLKSTYWKALGYPDGVYRVGPLARVIVADRMGTPRADAELERFRARVGRVPSSSFHYHHARLIDMLYAIERIEQLLRDPDILSTRVRSVGGINRNEGIGVSEAPRGTLMHHYRVDDDGIVQWANLVIATGHNNLAMNRSVAQVAKAYVRSARLTEPMLNRVEAVIRCYDPCLSCSTHALGEMPLRVQLLAPDHSVIDELGAMIPGTGVVVVCYGNPLRGDDAVGWRVAESMLEDPRLAGAHVMTVHQLLPELAVEMGEATLAILVDARIGEPPGSISVAHVAPSAERGAWTHHLTPAALAGLARAVSGRSADVVVVSIGVESTEPGHGLSHAVADAVPAVREIVADLVLAHA